MKLVRDKPTKSFHRSSSFPSLTASSAILPLPYFFLNLLLPGGPHTYLLVDSPFFSTDLRLREKERQRERDRRGQRRCNDTFPWTIRFVFHTPFHLLAK